MCVCVVRGDRDTCMCVWCVVTVIRVYCVVTVIRVVHGDSDTCVLLRRCRQVRLQKRHCSGGGNTISFLVDFK